MSDKDPSESIQKTLAKEVVKSNQYLAALAMDGGKTWARISVYVCYVIATLCIIILLIPPYETPKQLTVLGFGGAFLLFAVVLIFNRYNDLTAKDIQTKEHKNIDIPDLVRVHMLKTLEDTRKHAFNFLRVNYQGLSDYQIRANIFFPVYEPATDPSNYVLKIYPGLHIRMENPPEIGITLQPGQGATGQTFNTCQGRVTHRLEEGDGDWESVFEIDDELAKIIHPDLKWIISLPLKGRDDKPIGVVNIDGLQDQFSVDKLYACMGEVTLGVIVLSAIMKENNVI